MTHKTKETLTMIDASDLRHIIRETLSALLPGQPVGQATVDLIQMTFFMETGGGYLFSNSSPQRHGFMQMTRQNVEDVVVETIRPCDRFVFGLADACLVEAREDDPMDIFVAASYNIALQVALTYFWYLKRAPGLPTNVQSAAETYLAHWKMTHVNTRHRDKIVKDFLAYQKTTT